VTSPDDLGSQPGDQIVRGQRVAGLGGHRKKREERAVRFDLYRPAVDRETHLAVADIAVDHVGIADRDEGARQWIDHIYSQGPLDERNRRRARRFGCRIPAAAGSRPNQ
jgi:hypothetical protein